MGVKGLWQYIEHHHITYQPPKDVDSVKGGLQYALRPQHLLLDMNAILHACYSADRPTSKATLQAVRTRVLDLLRRIQPSETLVIVFDGVAPVAKLVEQKTRRKGLPAKPPRPAPRPSAPFAASPLASVFTCDYANTEVPLRQEHITAGSEFVYACEQLLSDMLSGEERPGVPAALNTWRRLRMSSSTEPGEGEVKIARCIRAIWEDSEAAQAYHPDDAFTIVGNDSDLLLVALAATPYRYFTLVDPNDFTMTCLHELLEHWSRSVPNPPIAADLLPSWRLDFVFIMLLSGCDYYDGVRSHAVELWRRYRDLRTNHGFYRKQLVSGPDFTLDVHFLRRLTEKTKRFMPQTRGRQKGGPNRRTGGGRVSSSASAGSVAHGTELLKAALWNFKGYVLGRCVDYAYISSIKRAGEIPVGALRAAAERAGIANAIGAGAAAPPPPATENGAEEGDGAQVKVSTAAATRATNAVDKAEEEQAALAASPSPPLSALEQCLAVLGIRSRYSAELLLTLESFTPDRGLKLTTSQSTRHLVETVKELMSHVDVRRLSGAEQALLASSGADTSPAGHAQAEAAFMTLAKIKPKAAVKLQQEAPDGDRGTSEGGDEGLAPTSPEDDSREDACE